MPKTKLGEHVKQMKEDPFDIILRFAFARAGVGRSMRAEAEFLGMPCSTYRYKLKKQQNGRRGFTDADYWAMIKKLDLSCEEFGKMMGCRR